MKRQYVTKPLSGLILASLLVTAGCSEGSRELRAASSERAMAHQLGTARYSPKAAQKSPSEIIPPMPDSHTAGSGPVADTYPEAEKTAYQLAKEDSPRTLPSKELEVTAAEVTQDWGSGPATLEDYDLLDAKVETMTYGEVRSRFDTIQEIVKRTDDLATHQQERQQLEVLNSRVTQLGSRISGRKDDTQIAYPDLVRKVLEVQLEVDEFYGDLNF